MSSTTDRLDRIEHELPPLEAVLVWLSDAHVHRSVSDYVRATIDLPRDQAPLTRIVDRVMAYERGQRRGAGSYATDVAVKEAVREAVFRYHLAVELESDAASFALRYDAIMLLALHRLVDEVSECHDADRAHRSCSSKHWSSRTATLTIEALEQARDARHILEARYLGGRSVLFPATADAWDALERHADTIRMLQANAPACAADPAPLPGAVPTEGDPVLARADALIDEALVRTHDFLGETAAADAVLRHRIMGSR